MKTILFQDSYLLSGIMCFDGCGKIIESSLKDCIDECIKEELLPTNAQLTIDTEPHGLGIHKLVVVIESPTAHFMPPPHFTRTLTERIKDNIFFDFVEEEQEKSSAKTVHWINLILNLLVIGIISGLAFFMPPSIGLTIGLTSLSFITTAFTARNYLLEFLSSIRNKKPLFTMNTTISLGWLLSLAHSLFHAISMPVFTSASMIFMNFIMPVVLIACINSMDEVKRLLIEKAKKHHLKNLQALFPQMAQDYLCHELSPEHTSALAQEITFLCDDQPNTSLKRSHGLTWVDTLLIENNTIKERKNALKKGMIIQVPPNTCFPVDCIIIKGNTLVDSSLLTGEPLQNKRLGHSVPAGAINLGPRVTVYATNNSYNSTINQLLLRANRAREIKAAFNSNATFWTVYTGLIVLSLISAVTTPVILGIATLPLLLQNVIGILFAICPCTIALAHQLPYLLNHYHLSTKGIHLRDESLQYLQHEIHTYVFDKTGTLTTNASEVASTTIPETSSIWQRIYILEQAYGRDHPIAKAIMKYCKPQNSTNVQFEAEHPQIDSQNRGLGALIQGKQLHIGNASYLKDLGIEIPEIPYNQGMTCVHVAENGIYQGMICIQHQLREDIRPSLHRLKQEKKKLIMLTGDRLDAARALNRELGFVFNDEDIHAEQKPQDKEAFLEQRMSQDSNPNGFCFVGDGLNDAPCCRMVSEKGGLSCSMEAHDKSTFFTDMSLNGSLRYLFHHNVFNQRLHKSLFQNQGIMMYSIISSLLFTLSFSITGLAIPPLIPMAIMLATTLAVLFNSYRIPLSINKTLDTHSSWSTRLLASTNSLNFLLSASLLLLGSLITATFISGTLTLPVILFDAGYLMTLSSLCTVSALGLLGVVSLAFFSHIVTSIRDDVKLKQPLAVTELSSSLAQTNAVFKSFDSATNLGHRQSSHFAIESNQSGEQALERREWNNQEPLNSSSYKNCSLFICSSPSTTGQEQVKQSTSPHNAP